jgi:hypothetical protein
MKKCHFLFLVVTICVACLPIASAQAESDNTYPIFCIYFRVKAYNQDGDFTGLREIIYKKMRISFSRHLLWPLDIDDSDFSSIEFSIPEDHSFGIVSTVDGELEVIGTSQLPLSPPGGWEKGSDPCELFALSQESAAFLMAHVAKQHADENFRFIDGYQTRRVEYARFQKGWCIYSRSDLDHKILVAKYSRTRFGNVPYLWEFTRYEYSPLLNETDNVLIPTQSAYFYEAPEHTDTWDLYWAYRIGIDDDIYDPSLYHDWWTFLSMWEYEISDSSDKSRPTYYLSDQIPQSVTDFYEISKYASYDSAG